MKEYEIRDDFIQYGRKKEYKKNQYIFDSSSSDESSYVYYLDRGIASLNRISEEGDMQVYLYFGEKRVIGFTDALIRHYPASRNHLIASTPFWIMAKTDCTCYCMRNTRFETLLRESPRFTDWILSAAISNYMDLLNKSVWAMDGDNTAQLCQWLLTCRVEKDGRPVIPKTFSLAEVARYLGIHPVTVSRIVRKLTDQGAIAREDGWIILKDEDILRGIRNGHKSKD